MELKLPEILAKYIAKQIVEAMLENDKLLIMVENPDESSVSPYVRGDSEDVLDILFPEDSDNG